MMVNPDDYLEMAAARYADLVIRALDPDLGGDARKRERNSVALLPIRLSAAALLRRFADALQPESDTVLADQLALTR